MPGKVKVKIIAGRNLPVMDRSSDTTDAYVEIKLGTTTYKTDVCRKSLNPQWNSEWYRFEMDDAELQDEPLQIRLMDHDTYSANDAIGKVYLDLNPLLLPCARLLPQYAYGEAAAKHEQTSSSVMSGWIPVYDTMHGIRGEVNVTVKIELFSDFNKFRQSSCGVQFFCSPVIPHGYYAQVIHGFVEELVVNDDPEYQWIDKIRTPRASNEARQTLFFKLSGELQRKIGLKALDLGGNAVIAYSQCFDLEGDSGIVARGIGTAVTLIKLIDLPTQPITDPITSEVLPVNIELDTGSSTSINKMHASLAPSLRTTGSSVLEHYEPGHHRTESVGGKTSQSPARVNMIGSIHRRSSDSDLSITPKGNSLTGSDRSGGLPSGHFMRTNPILRSTLHQDNFDMLEYPFLTMSKYPPGFIMHLGGTVNARSVKLLERITNLEEPESRDTWWSELRMEMRSHARALSCNAVLGYTESASICDDVCVLSASGTAAVIGFHFPGEVEIAGPTMASKPHYNSKDHVMPSGNEEKEKAVQKPTESMSISNAPESPELERVIIPRHALPEHSCTICHLPYSGNSVPLRVNTWKCGICKVGKVPDVLITTIEMPDGLASIGRGCFLQAYVCRPLKDLRGELITKEISDGLPFLEYELHRILVTKLKVKGMNAVFGLKVKISIGVKMMCGIATGTAVFLLPLPAPPLPKLVSDRTVDEKKLVEMQKLLHETIKKNKEIYQLKTADLELLNNRSSDNDDSEDDQPILDLASGNKNCYILEVDDPQDIELMNLLMEPRPPDGFHVVNTELVPGLEELEIVKNLQMFTQIWRAKIQTPYNFAKHFHRLLQSVYFKLRRMIPCALCDLQFRIDLPEPDEIQLSVLGMALGLGDPPKFSKHKRKNILFPVKDGTKKTEDELIFNLEDDQIPEHNVHTPLMSYNSLHAQALKLRPKSPQRTKLSTIKQRHVPYRERHGVDITPLSYVPGGKIERYLGNLNFFFIRETTSIREEGGLSGFLHSFITEVLAIVRAHVTALGGNAMVAYYMTECVLYHSLHKNQGQCLINVGGDVVFISYFSEDQ